VLGAGGTARETYWVIKENNPEARVLFVDDEAESDAARIGDESIPVIRDWWFERFKLPGEQLRFSVGIEEPRRKKAMVERALRAGLQPAPPLVSPTALYRSDAVVGVGTVGHARCYISTNVRVGDFVLLLPMAGLAHDVTLGNYVTCAPVSTTCAYSVLGDGVYVGQGSGVRERLVIAPWVRIDMQSSVVKSIDEPGIEVSGVPAQPVRAQEV
jgi:UDP-3-O-[3-hydroxymyristoyl] glucosamine N-acyltransferase